MSDGRYDMGVMWLKTLRCVGLSAVLYALLLAVMALAEVEIVWDAAMVCSVVGSVAGVGYVLAISNPQNYTGFYFGLVMTLFLAAQFFLLGSYDLTVLYVCVFAPFLVMSIRNWRRGGDEDEGEFAPSFMKWGWMLAAFAVFVAVTGLDVLLLSRWITPGADMGVMVASGAAVASSVLGNFLLIYKKTDAWVYWIVYSVAGIVLAVLIRNHFNVMLFSFFLIINTYTAVAWIRRR